VYRQLIAIKPELDHLLLILLYKVYRQLIANMPELETPSDYIVILGVKTANS